MNILQLAQQKDWEALNRISKQVLLLHAGWHPDVYEVVEDPYPMEYLLEDIQEKCLYVARQGNTIVGYVRFRIWETNGAGTSKRKIMQIEDIGVEETLRNQGIGKKMMEDLKELAFTHGCTDMKLYVDAENDHAFDYYKRCGFHVRNVGMELKL